MGGIKRGHIQPYLDHFMFVRNNKNNEPLDQLLEAIKTIFPLNSKTISQYVCYPTYPFSNNDT